MFNHKIKTMLVLRILALSFVIFSPNMFSQEDAGLDINSLDTIIAQYASVYEQNCAACHGENLEGTGQGTPLNGELAYGDLQSDIERSISNGFLEQGMPAWSNTLSEDEIRFLALYVSETRAGLDYNDYYYNADVVVPNEIIESELQNFRLETIIDGIDPLPFSIEPLPDGRLLLTEKKRGLSIVSMDGTKSDYISGTPEVFSETFLVGAVDQEWGYGWMLEVALHPDYDNNGWIYMVYTDRCSNCNAMSTSDDQYVSMPKVVRGRIRNGAWVDQETIWQADTAHYGPFADIAAGGRLTFDNDGHLFFSIGMKGPDNYQGIQDVSTPWGKIHRVYTNGDIPTDNPYYEEEGAYQSVWTYGHRSPQGLEVRQSDGQLWETEMGPRGGDEVNLLLPARNYGWPLFSLGMNYDGTEVDYGKLLGIDYDLEDIEQTIVDMTPSPAVSTFVFYEGDAFSSWQDQMIVGSLKARSLFRLVFEDNQLAYQETLISDLARIRDIEIGNQGEIFLLLENNAGGQIVRMVPANN